MDEVQDEEPKTLHHDALAQRLRHDAVAERAVAVEEVSERVEQRALRDDHARLCGGNNGVVGASFETLERHVQVGVIKRIQPPLLHDRIDAVVTEGDQSPNVVVTRSHNVQTPLARSTIIDAGRSLKLVVVVRESTQFWVPARAMDAALNAAARPRSVSVLRFDYVDLGAGQDEIMPGKTCDGRTASRGASTIQARYRQRKHEYELKVQDDIVNLRAQVTTLQKYRRISIAWRTPRRSSVWSVAVVGLLWLTTLAYTSRYVYEEA
ncbi:hypothetical protein ON010_g8171 [Phytophthora cinnamomi]|nr:hypothetical protein ON010_g8171 [Phytophthora cinnamomi]